jgi:hypothetical protein
MLKRNLFYYAALVGLGMILLGHVAYAATVTLRVGSVQATAGSTVEVPIEAIGAPGIGPMEMGLAYDPAVLTAETVTRGALLSGNALMEFNVAPRGRVVIALVASDPIKGDGAIVNVRFKVIGNAGQSALTLQAVRAWERGNQREVLVKTEAGKVTVAAVAPDLLPALLLGAACLLGLGLTGGGGIWVLGRRRRSAPPPQPYTGLPPRPSEAFPTDLPERGAAPKPPRPTDLPR